MQCGKRRVIPSGEGSSILPSRVANQGAGFGSPARREVSYTIGSVSNDHATPRTTPCKKVFCILVSNTATV